MKKYFGVILYLGIELFVQAQNPNTWMRKADFGGTHRAFAKGFSIDSFGYVGLGYFFQTDSSPFQQYPTDLWQYNPSTDGWMLKANFPAHGRWGSICFTIGSKAYFGLGNFYKDFWEYDPAANSWTQKADFPGGSRDGAIAFSLGNRGYAGLGYSDTSTVERDFWEYDPALDIWTRKSDFAGSPRQRAVAFSIGSRGYVGLGYAPNNGQISLRDFWEYDSTSDSWLQKASFPDVATSASFCFSIGAKGYVGLGDDSVNHCYSNFWEYNPLSDQWLLKDSFGGGARTLGAGFSIGNRGFGGTGLYESPDKYLRDFWMYTPDSISTGIADLDATNITISPNPATDKMYINNLPSATTLTVSDMTGRVLSTSSGRELDVSALPSGIYLLYAQNSAGAITKRFVKE
jgi:hypothetical protein